MTKKAAEFHGFIDYYSRKSVNGWIIKVGATTKPLSIEVLVDGVVVLEQVTNVLRPDVASAFGCSELCGFEISLEKISFKDPYSLSIRAKNSAYSLLIPKDWQPYEVYIERITAEHIDGWAWNPFNTDERAQIHFFLGSEDIGSTIADRYRSDLESAGIGNGEHAFQMQLPHGTSVPVSLENIKAIPSAQISMSQQELAPAQVVEDHGKSKHAQPKDVVAEKSTAKPAPEKTAAPLTPKKDWRKLASMFFDESWYSTRVGQAKLAKGSWFDHWWNQGRHNGWDPHPIFDTKYYSSQLGNHQIPTKDLFLHFLEHGRDKLTDPHICFSMRWYQTRYTKRDQKHPWIDYIQNGASASREPNWLFSHSTVARMSGEWTVASEDTALAYYLKHLGSTTRSPHSLLDLEFATKSIPNCNRPYEDFWRVYSQREIRTHLYFDHNYYLSQIKGRTVTLRALADYTLEGEKEGLKPIPLFFPEWYKRHYKIGSEYKTALEDYVDIGEKLFRHPCPGFDPSFYLQKHNDVARAGREPLKHFLAAGQRELRRPSARFDIAWYAKSLPDSLRASSLEHFLNIGCESGLSPHPAVKVIGERYAASDLLDFLQPEPLKNTVVPGLQTVFSATDTRNSRKVSPSITGQPFLVDQFENEKSSVGAFSADRLKRFEPIVRQYEVFDEDKAREYSDALASQPSAKKAKPPLISVVMPTRNRAGVLRRAIRSVLTQTHQNVELIIIDDGGTDGTDKLIQNEADDRIVYTRINAAGVSAARNKALDLAKGTYVAYLDSDNYWEPRHLELVLKAMQQSKADAAYSVLRIFNDRAVIRYRGDHYDDASLRRENYIDMNVYMHHRSLLDLGVRFDETLKRCVDWDFILRCSKHAIPKFVPIIGCNYVDDSGSLERITTNELSGDFYRVCQRNIDLSTHITGKAPVRECRFSIVWPISQADWPHVMDDLWTAAHHLLDSDHELIIVNNALGSEATNTLTCLARNSTKIRVINLWRSFFQFPATNLASVIAAGKKILLWNSGLKYNAAQIQSLVSQSETDAVSKLWVPIVTNANGMVVSRVARADLSSYLLEPLLTGQISPPPQGKMTGIVPISVPALIDTHAFKEAGGFDANFAINYGLAEFGMRLLNAASDATTLRFNVRFQAHVRTEQTPSENEFVKELEALKERWVGKLAITPRLSNNGKIQNVRNAKPQVLKWNLLPDSNSGSLIHVPSKKSKTVIAIRCPAPPTPDKLSWGDYHYADAMVEAINKLGYPAVIELSDTWGKDASQGDIVIHLRGIIDVKRVSNALNLMWVISHPDKISAQEYAAMDLVFVASAQLKEHVRQSTGISSEVLIQATDARRFGIKVEPIKGLADKALFIGNSRLQMRKIVADAIRQQLPLALYGKDWGTLIPSHFVSGEYVPNEELGNWYGSAGVVLNDHWPAMREYGIISNRIFDVVASGRPVITDAISGLENIFGDAVQMYTNPNDLREMMEKAKTLKCKDVSKSILKNHTIENRVQQIFKVLGLKTL